MIFWRGLGAVGLAFALIGFAVGMAVWSGMGAPEGYQLLFGGAGGLLGSIGGWFFSQYRNNDQHRAKLNEALHQHAVQVQALVQVGAYRGPQGQVPSSAVEAQQMADAQLAADEHNAISDWQNRDTMYGIPLRYTTIGLGILCLALFGIGVGQAFS